MSAHAPKPPAKQAQPLDKGKGSGRFTDLCTNLRRMIMATGKRKISRKLRWRSKKANHGKKPCSGR
ncbi:MAG: hypothetical protein AMXMBFR75_01980 [Candidatus Hinthialibacteria bacterium]